MTLERDIERLLDVWLAEGPTQVSDRAFEDAVERLPSTRQRPAWRLPRRDLTMSTNVKLAAAALAVIAVAAVGSQFLNKDTGPGTTATPTPSPTATPTPSPTPAPSPTPIAERYCPDTVPACAEALPAGHYTTTAFLVPFSFDVPGGWSKPLDVAGAVNLNDTSLSNDVLGVWPDWQIANQTSCSERPEEGVGRTVDDLSTWLLSQPGLATSGAGPTTIGGLSGRMLEIEVADNATTVCPLEFSLFTHYGTINDGGWWTFYPDERSRLYILDAGGERTITIDIRTSKDAFAAYAAAAQTIVDTFDFTP